MARGIAAALGLVMSVTVGAGLGVAHAWGAPQKPATESVTDDAADSFDAESQTGGDDVEIEGTLEVLVEDRADGERYRHVLSTLDGKRWPLQGLDLVVEGPQLVRRVPQPRVLVIGHARRPPWRHLYR